MIRWLAALLAFTTSAQAACLSYQGRVRLEGVLERVVLPGPPNYSSVAEGDRAETPFLLRPATPICVTQGSTVQEEAEHQMPRLQLLLEAGQYQTLVPLLGRRVRLSGQLMHAQTGHHHTAVLLQAVRRER